MPCRYNSFIVILTVLTEFSTIQLYNVKPKTRQKQNRADTTTQIKASKKEKINNK